MSDIYQESLLLHKSLRGKLKIQTKIDVKNSHDLSRVYSPGVAEPCREIAKDEDKVYDYTIKGNTVAIITDGSAVLGLGNIGAKASLPVMEGKAILFKKFAGIDAFPICLDTQDADEIIRTIKIISPVFGGVNLEDIAAPKSFVIEEALQDIGIPVFHDDQHGTAIVTLAGLINAAKVVGKNIEEMKVVVNGAGAAGVAIAKLLRCVGHDKQTICKAVKEIIICDSKGVIHKDRDDLNDSKRALLAFSNHNNIQGTIYDAMKDADVFVGVSKGNILERHHIESMAKDPIIFAMANPTPEIMPDEAYAGGAAIVGTGRSDLPNQINNVLAFPGIFRGALDIRAKSITAEMKMAAALAIAKMVENPTKDYIIPTSLNERVAWNVADAVSKVELNQ